MKAITVRQPWAWSIFHAGKNVENRTWRPSFDFVKAHHRIAIHTSGRLSMQECGEFAGLALQREFEGRQIMPAGWQMPGPGEMVCGAIIGTVVLWGLIHWTVDMTECRERYPWWIGDKDGSPIYGWVLTEPVLLTEPIPMRGQLGLWDVPGDVRAMIDADR
jgi:hypothetical protein